MPNTNSVISEKANYPIGSIDEISPGDVTVFPNLTAAFREWETPHEQEIIKQLLSHGVPINDCRVVRIASQGYIGVAPTAGKQVTGKKWYAIFGKHYISFSSDNYQKIEFCDQASRTRSVAREPEPHICNVCYLDLSLADLETDRMAHEWCQ